MSIWNTIKSFIFGPSQPRLIDQFRETLEAEAAARTVNDQITDAVTTPTPEALIAVNTVEATPSKPKRARTAKGTLKRDDTSTPDVNEAWEGGKAPVKKTRAKKAKK